MNVPAAEEVIPLMKGNSDRQLTLLTDSFGG